MAKVNSTISLLAAGSISILVKTISSYKSNESLKINLLNTSSDKHKDKISIIISEVVYPGLELLIADLLDQVGVEDVEVLIDQNLDLKDQRVKNLFESTDQIPSGWSKIPWTCQKLAFAAEGEILVFINPRVLVGRNLLSSAIAHLKANQLDAVYAISKTKNPFNQGFLDEVGRNLLTINQLHSETAISSDFFMITKAAYNKIAGHTRVGTNADLGVGLIRVLQQHQIPLAVVNAGSLLTIETKISPDRALATPPDLAARVLTYLVPWFVFIFSKSKSLKFIGFVGIKLSSFLSYKQVSNYRPIDFQKIALTPLAALVSTIYDVLAWWKKWKA